jgi:ABC-type glutathione transport system ATPase component
VRERGSTLVEIRDLTISYRLPGGNELRALDRISLNVSFGESIAITGKSGSGKSTLALAIMRMLPRNAIVGGAIRYRGQDLFALSESAMEQLRGRRMSMIFQQPQMALHPFMRAERQVFEVIRAHHRWSRSRCIRQARAVLEEVFDNSDVERIREQYPHQLSGGECQRVCIAQAFACRPEFLIADEPTGMLDSVAQAGVLRIFHDLCRRSELSLILITHNPALLPGLVDRTVPVDGSDA